MKLNLFPILDLEAVNLKLDENKENLICGVRIDGQWIHFRLKYEDVASVYHSIEVLLKLKKKDIL